MKDERVEKIMVALGALGWDVWERSGNQPYMARHTTPGRDLLVSVWGCSEEKEVEAELELGHTPDEPTHMFVDAKGEEAIMELLVRETLASNEDADV